MSLTGTPILMLAIFLTFAGIVATAYFWQKIYRDTFSNFILRVLTILLCQVLFLGAFGIWANANEGIYSSWSDFIGVKPDYTKVAMGESGYMTIDKKILDAGTAGVGGQVLLKQVVKGTASKVNDVIYILLPANIVKQIRDSKRIDLAQTKIVEFLVGFPSQPEIWLKAMNLEKEIYLASKKEVGSSFIAVIPAVNVDAGTDLECMNFPNGGIQTETWLSTDVHAYVNQRLGIHSTKPWYLMGTSAGGWCSAMLAIKHPDLFAGGVSIAGYYAPALSKETAPAVKAQLEKKYDFVKLEESMTTTTHLLIISSVGDSWTHTQTQKFLQLPHSHIAFNYIELKSGGHTSRVWRTQIPNALEWITTLDYLLHGNITVPQSG